MRPAQSELGAPHRHSLARAVLRYLVIGGGLAIAYTAAIWWFHLQLGYPRDATVALAFVCTTLCHFFLNRALTFQAAEGPQHRQASEQFLRFLVVVAVNLAITHVSVRLLTEAFGVPVLFATTVTIGLTVVTGFLLNCWWVFDAKSPD
jgi:putative flippase GtrA